MSAVALTFECVKKKKEKRNVHESDAILLRYNELSAIITGLSLAVIQLLGVRILETLQDSLSLGASLEKSRFFLRMHDDASLKQYNFIKQKLPTHL